MTAVLVRIQKSPRPGFSAAKGTTTAGARHPPSPADTHPSSREWELSQTCCVRVLLVCSVERLRLVVRTGENDLHPEREAYVPTNVQIYARHSLRVSKGGQEGNYGEGQTNEKKITVAKGQPSRSAEDWKSRNLGKETQKVDTGWGTGVEGNSNARLVAL